MPQVAVQAGAGGALNKEMDVRVSSGLLPQAVAATLTTEPISADLQGFDSCVIVLNIGTCTDGEYTVALTDSADDTTFAAVAALDAAFTVISSTEEETIEMRRVNVQGVSVRRYIKCTVTETSAGTTGVVLGITYILGNKRHSDGGNVI